MHARCCTGPGAHLPALARRGARCASLRIRPVQGQVVEELALAQEGDVLYMPRGTVHQAVAQEQDSVHLTISTYQRWTHGELLQRWTAHAAGASRSGPGPRMPRTDSAYVSLSQRWAGLPRHASQAAALHEAQAQVHAAAAPQAWQHDWLVCCLESAWWRRWAEHACWGLQ